MPELPDVEQWRRDTAARAQRLREMDRQLQDLQRANQAARARLDAWEARLRSIWKQAGLK